MKRGIRQSELATRNHYDARYQNGRWIKGMYTPFAEPTYANEMKFIDTTKEDYRECAAIIDATFERMEKVCRMKFAVQELRRRTQQGDVS